MKRIVLIFILTVSLVYGADIIPIIIDDFSYGLNTVNRGYNENLGWGTIVHNIDLTKHPGDAAVRDGYDSVFAIPGIDSFLWNGLHAINFLDGTKKLAIVGDSVGAGYANVYVTTDGTIEFGTIDSFFYTIDTAVTNILLTAYPTAIQLNYYLFISGSCVPLTIPKARYVTDLDSSLIPSDVIDSLVVALNGSSCSDYITASRIGDTLLIVEDSVSLTTNITPYDSLTLLYPDTILQSRVVLSRQSGFLDDPSRIATRFPATGQLWWTQFKGVTYLGTGTGKAISYDGRTVNKFPMKAPGEVDIIPLTTAGTPDGTYRYAMMYGSPTDSVADTAKYTTIGYLSTPVRVDSQQIMLKDFPLPNADYYYEGADTVTIELWRTVGDIGRLDKADSIWFTGIIITMADSAAYANTIITDTISDSTLRAMPDTSNIDPIIIADGDFHRWQSGKIDSTIHRYTSKPGSPSIISWDTATGNLGMWGEEPTGYDDTVNWTSAAGFSYMCVFVDTNLNSPSDSGRSFNFYRGSNLRNKYWNFKIQYNDSTFHVFPSNDTVQFGFSQLTTEKVTMVLPRTTGNTNQVMLYRGAVIPTQYDTSTIVFPVGTEGAEIEIAQLSSDSFFVPYYYLIGAFNPGDTIIDSLNYDSLLTRETYKRNAVPPLIKQMVTVDNQLLATDGQYLYESNPTADSVAFNVFSKSPINLDDGDEITTLIVQRGVVRLLKNKSTFILKCDNNGYWRDLEASKNYGSVTAFSHAAAPEGDYFLSNDGVRLEDENIYREKSNIGSLMSGQLNNFTNMTLAQQKGCFAKYIDNKYILSFPALNTSYILNKAMMPNGQYRYGWSTWDGVVMTGGDFYAVRKDNIIYPGDTLYFIKSGSNGIYRYGTANKDNGVDIRYIWESSQLTSIFDGYKQISKFYLEVESTDTVNASNEVTFWDERSNSSVVDLYIPLSKLDTSYIYAYSMPTATVNKSWKVLLSKNILIDGFASGGEDPETIIKQIYIEMLRRGNLPTR